MSEAISEMILPGTYVEVRSEGLIGAGSIATGNIGIVGTAARGPRNTAVVLGSYADALSAFGAADAASTANALTLVRTLQLAYRGGAGTVYAVRIANGEPVAARTALENAKGAKGFTITANSPGTWGNQIQVRVTNEGTAAAPRWQLSLSCGAVRETFLGGTVGEVARAAASSALVTVSDPGAADEGMGTVDPARALAGGNDQPNVSAADLEAGLAALEDQPVNTLLVAGFSAQTARSAVAAHLDRTENDGRDRIAILGARSSTPADVCADADQTSSARIALVAPGVVVQDAAGAATTLPPSYLAAVVAGAMSTLAPHVSLTNRQLPAELDVQYGAAVAKDLLQHRVLLARRKLGVQVVKGISTDAGAFKQLSVRRIVDYAKAGVRSCADPYIGRLNNPRVRAALKATLDGFLSQMILNEMLTEYQLDVSASRAEEIQGMARVSLMLKPTFSIDFIRVTIVLQ